MSVDHIDHELAFLFEEIHHLIRHVVNFSATEKIEDLILYY